MSNRTNLPATDQRAAAPAAQKPASSKAQPERYKPRQPLGIAVFVFVGSLMGSLLGVAADFGDATQTFERFQRNFYPTLCIVGSGTILGDGIDMAQDWRAAFEQDENYNVTIRGIGSVRGVEAAVAGECVHVLAMSEPMTDAQYNALTNAGIELACAAEIGYDVIAFVTDINNRVATIQSRVLPSILTGSITNWRDIGGDDQPITLLARPGSGTTDYVLINAAGYRDPDLTDQNYFPPDTNYQSCDSNEGCLDQVLATPGSLYWVSTAWMKTQPSEFLRVIPILRGDERPVNPIEQEVDLEEYPNALIRPLYMYVLDSAAISDDIAAEAREFLSYVRSVRGQLILEQYRFYTFFDRPTDVDVILPPGFQPNNDGLRPPVCRAS
jgi:phosphate transport system substrate-binding protein